MMFVKPMGALTAVLEVGKATVHPSLMSSEIGDLMLVIAVVTVVIVGTFQSRETQDHQKEEWGKELEDLLGHDDEGRKRKSRDPYLILQILIDIENKQTTTMKEMVGELKAVIVKGFETRAGCGYAGVGVRVGLCQPSAYPDPWCGLAGYPPSRRRVIAAEF
jgi:hypothetical protein